MQKHTLISISPAGILFCLVQMLSLAAILSECLTLAGVLSYTTFKTLANATTEMYIRKWKITELNFMTVQLPRNLSGWIGSNDISNQISRLWDAVQQKCAFVMSSQTFDSQQYLETQLDNDSQDFVIPVADDSPVDKPDDKPVLAGVRGVPCHAHKVEVAEDGGDSFATSAAPPSRWWSNTWAVSPTNWLTHSTAQSWFAT